MTALRHLGRRGLLLAAGALIATGGLSTAADRGAVGSSVREEGPAWSELKPAQQTTLAPLRQEWPQLETRAKRRWIELAARFPNLAPDEQARVQARMTQWAHMTPTQRGEARLNFQEAKQLAPGDRKARWDAYQALSPEQKRQLADRSMAQASGPATPLPRTGARADRSRREATLAPGAAGLPAPRAIAPALVQATPGATTTLIDQRPTPPEHQRHGVRANGGGDARGLPSARHRASDAAPLASSPAAFNSPASSSPLLPDAGQPTR